MRRLLQFLWPVLAILALIGLRHFLQTSNQSPGARLYVQHCQNCHMEAGEGLKRLIPPLANSDYLLENLTLIPCIILKGQRDTIWVNGTQYDHPMPALSFLSDDEVYHITKYLIDTWGDSEGTFNRDSLERWIAPCSE